LLLLLMVRVCFFVFFDVVSLFFFVFFLSFYVIFCLYFSFFFVFFFLLFFVSFFFSLDLVFVVSWKFDSFLAYFCY
jgi:hypothetical protein